MNQKKTPVEGRLKLQLCKETRKLSDLLVEVCVDYISRVKIYSGVDGSIWMRAIVSDEDGAQSLVKFRLERNGSQLTVSKTFSTVGGLAKRRTVFERLRVCIVDYLCAVSEIISIGISTVTFDTEGSFVNCFYTPSETEAGCIDLCLLYYKRTDSSLADIPIAGSDMVDLE